MKGPVLLSKIEIRNFTPVTTAGDYVEHKKSLKRIILEKIPNIDKLREKTMEKKLFLNVCFYLNAQTGVEGDTQKDLDNLLNAIFDVLPEYFTDEKNQPVEGLGLIKGKSDYMIFEALVSKKFVNTHEEEGFDIEISEMIEENYSSRHTKSISKWIDDKIFPKSNTQETRITKWITIYAVLASAIFSFGGVIIGIGMSFMLFGFSIQMDPNTTHNTNQTNPILFDFSDRAIELGEKFLSWGPIIIFFGAIS